MDTTTTGTLHAQKSGVGSRPHPDRNRQATSGILPYFDRFLPDQHRSCPICGIGQDLHRALSGPGQPLGFCPIPLDPS